jgi:serine/threonine protein kinase
MARKHCGDEDEYRTEYEIFRTIRRSQNQNERIIQLFCTLRVDHDFSLLLEFADGADLHNRLFHNVNGLRCYQGDMHENDDGALINRWCAANEGPNLDPLALTFQRMLIKEASNLAHALNYLHTCTIEGQRCYHMDLKPQNILVFFRRCEQDAVGQWKIADFGVSVFHAVRGGNPFLSGENTSRTIPRRPLGFFTPPEADDDDSYTARRRGVNHKGDVWSLGWILCMVLAYSLGGAEAVKDFWKLRSPSTGGGSRNPLFYDFRSEPAAAAADPNLSDIPNASMPNAPCTHIASGPRRRPYIKSRVRNWFNDLRSDHTNNPWVSAVLDVIEHCVMIEPDDRADADHVYHALYDISESMAMDQPSYESAMQAFRVRYSSRPRRHGSSSPRTLRDTRSFHDTSLSNPNMIHALIQSMPTSHAVPSQSFVQQPSAAVTNVSPTHNTQEALAEQGSSSGRNLTTITSSSQTSQSPSPSTPLIPPSSVYDRGVRLLHLSDIEDIAICPLNGRIIAVNRQDCYIFEPLSQKLCDLAYARFHLVEGLWTNVQLRGLYFLVQNSTSGRVGPKTLHASNHSTCI